MTWHSSQTGHTIQYKHYIFFVRDPQGIDMANFVEPISKYTYKSHVYMMRAPHKLYNYHNPQSSSSSSNPAQAGPTGSFVVINRVENEHSFSVRATTATQLDRTIFSERPRWERLTNFSTYFANNRVAAQATVG